MNAKTKDGSALQPPREETGKRLFYRAFHVTMAVSTLLFAGIAGYIVIDNHVRPFISTSSYHFNVQYRVGDEIAMNEVVDNSLVPLLLMYRRHPTWRADIEFQAQMIEHMEKMDNLTANGSLPRSPSIVAEGLNLTRIQLLQEVVQAGIVELVVVQYSDALAIAYPYIDFYKSIAHAQEILQKHGLENGTSRAVLLQEGQFFLGFARVLEDFPHYDTILSLRDNQWYFGVDNVAPLYRWQFGNDYSNAVSRRFGKPIYVMPWWITAVGEGGVVHHSLWVQDGENLNTGRGQRWTAGEGVITGNATHFEFNPEKMANHEQRLMQLERMGSKFYTLDRWIEEMIPHAAPLDAYILETHWQTFNYRGPSVWMAMGNGNDYYDDGYICGTNYRTHQILQAMDVLVASTYGNPNVTIDGRVMTDAWMDLADAEVTDTTGLAPRDYEGDHAIYMNNFSRNNASMLKDAIIANTTILADVIAANGSFQVVPSNYGPLVNWTAFNGSAIDWSRVIVTDESMFINFTEVSAGPYEPGALPVTIELSTDKDGNPNNNSFSITTRRLETPWDPSIDNLTYYSVRASFKKGSSSDWSYVKFIGDFANISYSPSMFENETITLARDDYYPDLFDYRGDWAENIEINFPSDNFEMIFALSNGLVYSETGGFAIVKNNTASHLCGKWKADEFRFMQTQTHQPDVAMEFFILPSVTRAQALAFANLVNTWAPVTISSAPFPTLELNR